MKSLLLFLLPAMFLMAKPSSLLLSEGRSNSYLIFTDNGDGTYLINGLSDSTLNEYRLYSFYGNGENEYHISEIDDHLFDDIDHDFTVLISRDITSFSASLFNNAHLIQINYTGSSEQWASLSLNVNKPTFYYQCDEGFINYWDEKVRPNSSSDVCLMKKSEFTILKSMYDELNAADKLYVNAYKDKANQTIEATMNYLSKYFSDENKTNNQPKKNLPKDMTIGIIVSVAIFGMTTICIFYILKRQGIIK